MKRLIALVAVVLFLFASGASAEIICAVDDIVLDFSASARTVSLEAYVQLTEGSSLSVDGWQTLATLSGPDTKVKITSGGKTINHTALFAPQEPIVLVSDDHHQIEATDFILASPLPAGSGAGLVRIDVEVQGGAVGRYAVNFNTGGSYLSQSISTSDVTPFDRYAGGSIVIVPEPSSSALCLVLGLSLLVRRPKIAALCLVLGLSLLVRRRKIARWS
jgi:hypothetical protein